MIQSPINEDKHCLENVKFLTFRQNTWHILQLCVGKGMRSHLLTDEDTLRRSHINADQSQSPGVLHQRADGYLDAQPPHFVHDLYVLIQSSAGESMVYLMPQSIASSERLNAPDSFFCVIKRYGFHVCAWSLWCSEWRQRLTCKQWIRFTFWQVVRGILAVMRFTLTLQMLKVGLQSVSWERFSINKLFMQRSAVTFQLRNEGNNYLFQSLSSLSTENPSGQGFNGLITMTCVKGDNKYGWFPGNGILSFLLSWREWLRCVIINHQCGPDFSVSYLWNSNTMIYDTHVNTRRNVKLWLLGEFAFTGSHNCVGVFYISYWAV